MNNAKINGKLMIGYIDQNQKVHQSFTLKLLTVKDEIALHNALLMNYPDLESKSEFEMFAIERAERLSKMILQLGEIENVTAEMLLSLTSEDFNLLNKAEANLIKKYSEHAQGENLQE